MRPVRFRKGDVADALGAVPAYPAACYDSVRLHFDRPLPADRPEREIALLDGLLLRFGAEDNPLSVHGARAMVGAVVQRALADRANMVKQIIMLSGVRDIGKSEIVKQLVPLALQDTHFLEGVDLSQDIEKLTRQIRRSLVVEIPEANGLNRAESSKVKTLVSLKALPYRPLFGSDTRPIPNRTALVATVNPNVKAIRLDDDAMAFRFPIVHLQHRCEGNLKQIMEDIREDLYTAARWLLRTGELDLGAVPSELNDLIRRAAAPHNVTGEGIKAMFGKMEDSWHAHRDGSMPPGIHGRAGWLDIGSHGVTIADVAQFAQAHDMAFVLQGQGLDNIVAFLRGSPDWDLRRSDAGKFARRRTEHGMTYVWVHLPSMELHEDERRDGKPEAPWVALKRKDQTKAATDARRAVPPTDNVVQMRQPVPPPPAHLGGPVMPTAALTPEDGDVT